MFNTAPITPIITVSLLVLGWLGLSGQPASDLLWFNRELIEAGQWWRLLTGHLVHYSTPHLLLNGLAFYLLTGQIRKLAGTDYLHRLLALLMIGSGLGLYLLVPAMIQYGGLSAVNYGLLTWLAVHHRNPLLKRASGKRQNGLRGLVVALLCSLCALQWWQGQSIVPGLSADDGPAVAWQAHLIAIMLAASVGWIVVPGPDRRMSVPEPAQSKAMPEGSLKVTRRVQPS